MAYERDGIAFEKPDFSWPLLGALMWTAACVHGNLDIIDVGGSLGSTYVQHRRFLDRLQRVVWHIVEQPHFVAAGKTHSQSDRLRFHASLAECLREASPQVIVMSSVLQYLPEPYRFLRAVKDIAFPTIILDRTGFIDTGDDRLTVQHVPKSILSASYPCWFFDMEKFRSFFRQDYEIMATFRALGGKIAIDRGTTAVEKGMVLVKKTAAAPGIENLVGDANE